MSARAGLPGSTALSRRDGALILAGWLALGLLESVKAWINSQFSGRPVALGTALVGNVPWWLAWAALTPLVVAAARRWRLDGRGAAAFGAHLAVSALLAALHHVAVGTLFYLTNSRGSTVPWTGGPMTLGLQLRIFFNGYFVLNVLTYWAALAGYYALEYRKRARAGELRAARLESDLHQARLEALRMELHPHFLFNTLNTVASLVEQQRYDDAVRMLAQLGDLLRSTLDQGREHRIPLDRELTFLELYLEIVRIRYSDRLRVEVSVDDAAREALVPTLILQPLVENAVRHGVAQRTGPGRIGIEARRENGSVELVVSDHAEGPPAAPSAGPGRGIGLANTRQRLEQLYGASASLRMEPLGDGAGTRVVVVLPFTAPGALEA